MLVTMSNYENAPATQMVATHCCVCHRPLLDAISVELGIGPDCRKKYYRPVSEDKEANRPAANKIVHALACGQVDVPAALAELSLMGFPALATRIAERLAVVVLTQVDRALNGGTGWEVQFTYDAAVVDSIRGIPGRRWDGETKTWFVPAGGKKMLWDVLRAHFHGKMALGPKGAFVVEAL